MFALNPQDKSPLYEQIIEQLVIFISNGILEPGDKLPSIRELASDLGINPNTVSRAYSELERREFIITYPKRGAFVREESHTLAENVLQNAKEILHEDIDKIFRLGLSEEEVRTVFEEVVRDVKHQEAQ